MIKVTGKYNTAKIFATQIDNASLQQVEGLCNQKWTQGNDIAIMPDVHAGCNCTIGTTMTLNNNYVCPNTIGNDIGCGMLVVELPFENIKEKLPQIDNIIKNNIPAGKNIYESSIITYNRIYDVKCYKYLSSNNTFEKSLGTLGGGNHFIEIDYSEKFNKYYLVIHSGSRSFGGAIANYYQKKAYEECNKDKFRIILEDKIKEMKKQGREKEISSYIKKYKEKIKSEYVSPENSYISGKNFNNYLYDMDIAIEYANNNRILMAKRIIESIYREIEKENIRIFYKNNNFVVYSDNKKHDLKSFTTIHNYIDTKNKILRKGAISCQKDEIVLIPISMKDGALICKGKGNVDYNFSGPHGAGRIYSRSEAKRKFGIEEFKKQMKDVYSSCVSEGNIDESPMAYKTKEDIIPNITDAVEILDEIKSIYNFKEWDFSRELVKEKNEPIDIDKVFNEMPNDLFKTENKGEFHDDFER